MSQSLAESKGRLIVISGPSGVGKTTVCEELSRRLPNAVLSVSVTTRPPRPHERDSVDYWFVSPQEFDRRLQEGGFLEHARYESHCYGTPAAPVHEALKEGRDVILEIDVQGGFQVRENMPGSIRIFVLPPSDEVLQARLAGRGTEDASVREQRLAAARREIELAETPGAYPHRIINDDVSRTVNRIISIINQETMRS